MSQLIIEKAYTHFMANLPLHDLLSDIRNCQLCAEKLPLPPRPVVRAHASAKLLIIGQAPGIRVHNSGIPWDDPSGKRLRQWLGVTDEQFYDETQVAIIPMGFCYPGKGKSGDLPPRPECATTWHERLLAELPKVQLTLLIGQYAQTHYLDDTHRTLTERVRAGLDTYSNNSTLLALPHPSPRNRHWLSKNPWFEEKLIPKLQARIKQILV
jgi:uracil-DNA glycosylase